MIIVGQPLVPPEDDLSQERKLLLDLKKFIHLLLIFNNGKPRLRMVCDISVLGWSQIRIHPHGSSMTRLGGQFGIEPLRRVVPDNQHLISGLEAEGKQTKGQVFDIEI